MRIESVTYLTEREEEFANLLIKIGTRRNVAMVLTYLANIPEATSRQIERGTDLRQPEVSLAMQYLIGRNWVSHREPVHAGKGRPIKIYHLSKTFTEIIKNIEDEKKREANQKILLTKKLHEYIC